jgi:hypothetical protein
MTAALRPAESRLQSYLPEYISEDPQDSEISPREAGLKDLLGHMPENRWFSADRI